MNQKDHQQYLPTQSIIQNRQTLVLRSRKKNLSDLFNFTVTLLEGDGNKISFPSNETTAPIIGIKIQIVK